LLFLKDPPPLPLQDSFLGNGLPKEILSAFFTAWHVLILASNLLQDGFQFDATFLLLTSFLLLLAFLFAWMSLELFVPGCQVSSQQLRPVPILVEELAAPYAVGVVVVAFVGLLLVEQVVTTSSLRCSSSILL
jgi:hypothetical protein